MDFNEENFNKLLEGNQDLAKQLEALKGNQDKLLSEAKIAKEAKRAAELEKEEAAAAALKEKEELDRANGNFKDLFETTKQKLDLAEENLRTINNNLASEKSSSAALKIASELAEGENIKLLAEFVTKRLKFEEGKVKVLDTTGQVTISELDDLKKEFANNPLYGSLVKGSGASGGSAGGSNNSGGAADKNPWKKETLNLTEQGRILQSDPILAEQFKKAAGVA